MKTRIAAQPLIGVVLIAALLSACHMGGEASTASAASSSSGTSPPNPTPTPTPPPSPPPPSPPPPPPANVTLQWTAPTQNTNGTSLTNLAGYDIYYGTQSRNYAHTIKVANPGLTTYVTGLSPGTYYFTISAYNSTGTNSVDSPEVSTTVQ